MCFKPKGPSPQETAQAQADLNLQSAIDFARLNQINEVTPFGSRTFSGEIGDPDRTVTTTLNETDQQILDAQRGVSLGLANAANDRLGQIPTEAFDITGGGSVRQLSQGQLNTSFSPVAGGSFARSVSQDPLQVGVGRGEVQGEIGGADPVQGQVSLMGLQNLPGLGDFSNERSRVEQAQFDRSTRFLGERLAQDEQALRTQLANQGITEGSEAFDRELTNFRRTGNEAFADARDRAILAGGQEQSRMFGLALSGRQQGVSERFGTADFANRAQAQDFGQQATRAQFANQAQAQEFAQAMANAELFNSAQGQAFSQGMQNAQLQNQSVLGDFERQRMSQQQSNDALLQNFNQSMQQRQQGINELLLQRNQAFNEAAAFLQGSPAMQTPQFNALAQYGPALASPDMVGLTAQQNQSRGGLLGGLFGSFGNLGAAAINKWG